ncbi:MULTISPECIES: hypothetical protein [Sphingobacterium]|uniref:hypothetical protein n=1 Tax=Sphingobacterium TaxID=28453 RepID=UPI000DB08957|nr:MULTISPECIES: hypothetical protein [Sphingobacterium]PZU22510.1 MAG: hypothetical protein DI622_06090 [Chryseobacterium sp.]
MKNLKLIFGVAAIAIGSMAAFSFGPSKEKEVMKNESKAVYYWFDATTNAYLGHSEQSDCNLINTNPCEVGYLSVSNPSNPQRPNSSPDKLDTGEKISQFH